MMRTSIRSCSAGSSLACASGSKLGDFVEQDRPAAREVERAFTVGKQLERAQASRAAPRSRTL